MQKLEQENHNTEEYYNKVFVEHFEKSGLDYSDTWRIDELLKKYQGGKLLDIGCGISPLCVRAALIENADVYGADFAGEILAILKTRHPYIKYYKSDFNKLPFEDNYFNYVVLGEVLEHSEDPRQIANEAIRILKTGGRLAISVPFNETKENHKYPQHIWGLGVEDIINMVGKEKIISLNILNEKIICHAKK